ncbi:hypothetical protein Sango_2856800 [Sesamum angolense]|uniref:Endonuclease/exonuclease/phosphatase domain-containing protein n=1 Tax=Sesamum angolense TaxID=2727404 RepID=A0AAE1VWT5_9LAMI|nr:hypothetical protein Sango_2856800 [Sesamum angolense]
MEEVIEGGPWLYLGQPIMLQKWEPGMVLRKLKHTEIPVWIKLRHLPVELWTTEGLSTVASGIGRPLYPDAITRTCTRLDFARACVMLNVSSKLPKHVVIMMPNELGGESACKVDVEYEWLPPKCTGCSSLGHSTKECPLSKPTKPVVSIYVRKSMPITPAAPKLKMKEHVQAAPVPKNIHPETEVDRVSKEMQGNGRDKAIWNVRGLNRRDHQVAVRDLVCEFRLHFIALLETRSLQSNVTHVYNQEYYLDGDGLLIMRDRVIVFGLHGMMSLLRRELWQELIELAGTIGNVPWLVGGDFNAVLDMSEVSGASRDIRVAMNEFNDCILQTGLLSLPMQGERFTWHNCSLDGRSLWKRLDRLLVNDVWMERWPNLYYTCLTPRTSDHSPMVLKGDYRNMQVSLFHFDNYLALSPGFLASVQSIWRHPVVGTPMYSVTQKLKALKPVFRQQRRSKGDLAMNVKLTAGFLEIAQNILKFDRHNPLLLLLEHCCRLVYLKPSKLEQNMLRQRAKLQWLKGGDQCSKIFFRRVATRRANKRVFQISDDVGNEQTDPTVISSIFVDFF